MAEHIELQRAEFQLKEAQTGKDVLTKYKMPKRVKELEAEVQRAKAKESAAGLALNEAREKLRQAERDFERFRLLRPQDLVLGRLNEAIKLQARLTGILSEAKRIQQEAQPDPASADEAAKRLRELEASARETRDEATSHLNEAIALSERWAELFEAEFHLQEARDRLAMDLELFGPQPDAKAKPEPAAPPVP